MINNKSAEEKNNKKRIFRIDSDIKSNESSIYQSRLIIEENRTMILNNYSAAFSGNNKLASVNTKEIYENRNAIIAKIEVNNELEKEFVQAEKNKASLDFMTQQSKINAINLEISHQMAEVNAKLIEINKKIMETNQVIVEFNTNQLQKNKELLQKKLNVSKINSETNNELAKKNREKMFELENKEKGVKKEMHKLLEKSKENSETLLQNRVEILDRRSSIMSNHHTIQVNRSKIFFGS